VQGSNPTPPRIDLQHLYDLPRITLYEAWSMAAHLKFSIAQELTKNQSLIAQLAIELNSDDFDIRTSKNDLLRWVYSTEQYFSALEQIGNSLPNIANIFTSIDRANTEIRFSTPAKLKELKKNLIEIDTLERNKYWHYWAVIVGEFWSENIPRLKSNIDKISESNSIKLIEIIPEFKARELMNISSDILIEYLIVCEKEIKVRTSKLSNRQKEILRKVYKKSYGFAQVSWTPRQMIEDGVLTDSVSRSLRELYSRKLLLKRGKMKTTEVQLSHLGYMAVRTTF
jgi:hypothetical protein